MSSRLLNTASLAIGDTVLRIEIAESEAIGLPMAVMVLRIAASSSTPASLIALPPSTANFVLPSMTLSMPLNLNFWNSSGLSRNTAPAARPTATAPATPRLILAYWLSFSACFFSSATLMFLVSLYFLTRFGAIIVMPSAMAGPAIAETSVGVTLSAVLAAVVPKLSM